ncbi:hypothetical protein CDL15_Pgr009877 [Punica granatum]|uniref:HMA domain-containing protein n=1 Tax=Punica granatum TaxID=22663 RepID=A0A218WVG5_PUNGR|nr:hypothetical protein CDL15_Pgr009877 [Punica granatum]PKI76974.1 hypothetical protein CRG98_002477 [Punica granatum]
MEDSSQHVVFKAYIHCKGCARDASRCLKGFDGVEGVAIDAANDIIVVKGESVDPTKVLNRLRKKFRTVKLISPIPQPIQPEKDPPKKEEIVIRTIVLRIPMHCLGCAESVERNMYKMRGVLRVGPGPEHGTVAIMGMIEDSQLLKHARKHVHKQAQIVMPEEPPAPAANEAETSPEEEEQVVASYFPQNSINHTCACCEMFNDENINSCCVM